MTTPPRHIGALSVACPHCCSPVGMSCGTARGTRTATTTHHARVRAWIASTAPAQPRHPQMRQAVSLLREAARALDDDDDDVAPYDVRERILRFLTTTKEAP